MKETLLYDSEIHPRNTLAFCRAPFRHFHRPCGLCSDHYDLRQQIQVRAKWDHREKRRRSHHDYPVPRRHPRLAPQRLWRENGNKKRAIDGSEIHSANGWQLRRQMRPLLRQGTRFHENDDSRRGVAYFMRVHASLFYLSLTVALSACRATPPGKWETAATSRIKHSITVRGKAAKNPLPETPENIKDGQTAFSHYCMA